MSEFFVRPRVLESEADTLWNSYMTMRSLITEIPAVIRSLQAQEGCFDNEILRLRRSYRKAEEQYEALRRTSKALDHIAVCCSTCEQRVLDRTGGKRSVRIAAPSQRFWCVSSTPVLLTPWWEDATEASDSRIVLYEVQSCQALPDDVVGLFRGQSVAEAEGS